MAVMTDSTAEKHQGTRLLTEREAAERLRVSPGTLTVWRSTRRYPLPFVRIGTAVRYRESDVEAFIESRITRGDDISDILAKVNGPSPEPTPTPAPPSKPKSGRKVKKAA